MSDEDQRDVGVVHRQHTPRIDDRGSPIPNFLSQLRLTDFSADFLDRIFDPFVLVRYIDVDNSGDLCAESDLCVDRSELMKMYSAGWDDVDRQLRKRASDDGGRFQISFAINLESCN
jgi:hypothetical protein